MGVSHASSLDVGLCWFDIRVLGPSWSVVEQPKDAQRRSCWSVVNRISGFLGMKRVLSV